MFWFLPFLSLSLVFCSSRCFSVLFVCGGAFNGLQDIIAKRTIDSSIGFTSKISSYSSTNTNATKDSELFVLVEPGDVVKYGLVSLLFFDFLILHFYNHVSKSLDCCIEQILT